MLASFQEKIQATLQPVIDTFTPASSTNSKNNGLNKSNHNYSIDFEKKHFQEKALERPSSTTDDNHKNNNTSLSSTLDLLAWVDTASFQVNQVFSSAASKLLGYELSFPVYTNGVILVTGAMTACGFNVCQSMADNGYTAVAIVQTEQQASRFQRHGRYLNKVGRIIPIVADLSKDVDIQQCLNLSESMTSNKFPFVGIVNCQTKSSCGPIELLSSEDLLDAYQDNTTNIVRVIQAFLPLLRQFKGRIVNVSSCAGLFSAAPANGSYAASKMALEAVSDSLRVELYQFGISVSIIEPGAEDEGIAVPTNQQTGSNKTSSTTISSEMFEKNRSFSTKPCLKRGIRTSSSTSTSLLSQSLSANPSPLNYRMHQENQDKKTDHHQIFVRNNGTSSEINSLSHKHESEVQDDDGKEEEDDVDSVSENASATDTMSITSSSLPMRVPLYKGRRKHFSKNEAVPILPSTLHNNKINGIMNHEIHDPSPKKTQPSPYILSSSQPHIPFHAHTYTDSSYLSSLYDPMLNTLSKLQDHQKAFLHESPNSPTTRAILHALTASYPQTRYLCGWDARMAATLKWIFPDRVLDWGYQTVLNQHQKA